jgi:hypothetical protein
MTKTILKSLLVVSMTSVVFTGCANDNANISTGYVDMELKDAPKWVMNPEVEGYIAELGSASRNAGNDFSFQRTEAMADARDNLTKQISIKVNNMFKSFKTATGSGKDSTFDKSSETVSKHIASQTLSGTKVKDTWISRSGTLYVLMVIDTKAVSDMMDKAIKTSFKNDKAMYQKFLASKAQGELEQELEKLDK